MSTGTVPEHVLVGLMDLARRAEHTARLQHDRIAYEVGFERVYPDQLQDGDVLVTHRHSGAFEREVVGVQKYTDQVSTWFRVTLADDKTQETVTFEDTEYVSRRLPTITEPF